MNVGVKAPSIESSSATQLSVIHTVLCFAALCYAGCMWACMTASNATMLVHACRLTHHATSIAQDAACIGKHMAACFMTHSRCASVLHHTQTQAHI